MSDRLEVDLVESARLVTGLGDVGRDLQTTLDEIRRVRAAVAGQRGPIEQALRQLSSAERDVSQVLRDLASLGNDLTGRARQLGLLESNMFTRPLFGPLPFTLPGLGTGSFPWPLPGPDAPGPGIHFPGPDLPGPDINFPGPDLPGPDINVPGPDLPGPDINIPGPDLPGPDIRLPEYPWPGTGDHHPPTLPGLGGILHSDSNKDGEASPPKDGAEGSPPPQEGDGGETNPPPPSPPPSDEKIDSILQDPNQLNGKTPEEVERELGKLPDNWKPERLGQGSHAGQGWMLREYGDNGQPTGRWIRWHPGGGHHGPDPYWRTGSHKGGRSPEIPGGPSSKY